MAQLRARVHEVAQGRVSPELRYLLLTGFVRTNDRHKRTLPPNGTH